MHSCPTTLRHKTYKTSLFVLLTLLLPAIVSAQESYDITFARPYEVGQRFAVRFEAQREQSQQIGRRSRDTTPDVEKQEVRLEGELEVLAVDSTGNLTEARYHVQEFTATTEDAAVPGIPSGATLHARLEGEDTRYYNGNTPLSETLSEVLGLIIKFRVPGRPGDTESFATDTPKTVGARWPVNRERAAASLTRDEVRVAPEDISGEVTLLEIVDREGMPAYRLEGSLAVSGLEMDMPRMSRLESATIQMTHTGDYPVNDAIQPLESRSVVSMDAHARGTGLARFLHFHLQETRTINIQMTPLETTRPRENRVHDADRGADNTVDEEDGGGWRVLSVE